MSFTEAKLSQTFPVQHIAGEHLGSNCKVCLGSVFHEKHVSEVCFCLQRFESLQKVEPLAPAWEHTISTECLYARTSPISRLSVNTLDSGVSSVTQSPRLLFCYQTCRWGRLRPDHRTPAFMVGNGYTGDSSYTWGFHEPHGDRITKLWLTLRNKNCSK